MTINKPCFTKIISDVNGIDDLKTLLENKDTDTVNVTPRLLASICDTYEFMNVDFSGCLVIESRNGSIYLETIAGDTPENAKAIITEIQIDAIRKALEQGDTATIETLYYSLNHRPTPQDTHADKVNATETKARKLYIEEHKGVVAKNLIEMMNTGKVAPTTTADDKISDGNREAGAFCVSKGVNAKGANPATCNKITALAYHDLIGSDLPSPRTWPKWDETTVKKYHEDLTRKLTEQGYL